MALKEAVEITKNCKTCGKEFKRITKMPWIPKFCSDFCSDRDYRKRHKKQEKARVYSWRENNKEKYNKHHLEYYKNKDRDKKDSRNSTLKFINKHPEESPIKKCKVCSSVERLEIHHEVYPKTFKEIREAIKNKKIYYLCSEHHIDIHLNK